MRIPFLYKLIFIFSLLFNMLEIISTPTLREFKDKYTINREKIHQIIFEKYNIDIENRATNNGYYGYEVEYKDECTLILALMDYSKKERFFNIDLCKNKSNFFKIINHEISPN